MIGGAKVTRCLGVACCARIAARSVRRTPYPADQTYGLDPRRGASGARAFAVSIRGCPVRPRSERVERRPISRRSKMAKYMLIMRGTDESVAKMMETPFEQMLETVGRFNEEMIRAGVLVAAEGLDDPSQGVVVDFSGETPVVTDGPYGETKELFGGFYVIDVATKQEAVEWAKRLPAVAGTKCEVRRVPSIDEFPQDNEWIIKERAWRERTGQLSRPRPPAARRSPRRRGGPSRPSGGSSPHGSSVRWLATPGTSSSPRTSRRRRWRRRSSPGRATVRRRTRWAGCSRPRGGAPSTASAAGRHLTIGTPCSPVGSPRVRRARARWPRGAGRTTCRGIPTGSTTTSSR